ncbi:MAG TPA: DNA polymerase III subunit beta [Gammaproteobacteria bacterium]|nr:DNA polymerase III subunit beta [Gammaproteobacteria bacterium]
MKITLSRGALLKPLTYVSSVVEKRQTLPILSNVLLQSDGNDRLSLTGTDLEVEVITYCDHATGEAGEISINARKLFDITRALPEGSEISISTEDNGKCIIRSGKSRFTVQTLPADDFPKIETEQWSQVWKLPASLFKQALTRTAFAMAQQDVRFYLNGLLLVADSDKLKTVATDGHRLAKTECQLTSRSTDADIQAIVPRKAITELNHIIEDSDTEISVSFNPNHIRVELDSVIFTSKLIDGRFPDYEKVIPKNQDKSLIIDRNDLQNTLNRAAILTNEKFRGVRLIVTNGKMSVSSNNPDQEEAFDEIDIEYSGGNVEIGFNVGYMLEALNAINSEKVEILLSDANSSGTIRAPGDEETVYIVMPMRL